MTEDGERDSHLQIAHVLFIDIVGYSKLLTSEQRERQRELNGIVRETEPFRAAEAEEKLIRIPTGDGMILAFFTNPDAPARCAVAISRALGDTLHLPLRMGIHSGPVELVEDVNDKPNLAGAGVNIAQRVMDCGDSGHILLSSRAANDLAEHAEWKAQLHELGELEIKHGVRIRVASLYSDGVGNAVVPQKLRRQRLVRRRRLVVTSVALAAVGLAIALGFWAWQRQIRLKTEAAAEAAKKSEKSVAVLPFENLSTDEQNAVFAGGVHREVLLNLAKLADLKVISRTSVMRYKAGADRNLKQIAEELAVSYVVEGSVQREAGHVRVSVELIDARTDAHAWAETYDGDISDVMSFQSEIAQRISNQLGAKLSPRERTELAGRPTKDIAAFESYIRARALMETSDADGEPDKYRDDYMRAVQLLEQAVARDPRFAAGYWALAEANTQLFRNDPGKPEFRSRADAAVKEAKRMAPDAGETLHAEARLIYYGEHDYHKALAKLEEAAQLLPNSAEVTTTRALLYRRFGRFQESFAQFLRAIELNPEEPFNYHMAGYGAMMLRWWEDGDRITARLIKKFPRFEHPARLTVALLLTFRGEVEAGDKEFEALNLDMRKDFAALFYRSFSKHDYAECRRLLDQAAKYPELENDRWDLEAKLIFLTKGPFDEAAALETEKRLEAAPEVEKQIDGAATNTLGSVKMLLGKKDEALRLCEESVKEHPVSEDASINTGRVSTLAVMYILAGERERALETMARLVQLPSGTYYGLLKIDPIYDGLRKDPRFEAILKQAQQPFPRL
jgi:TolB-like protein